MESFDSTVMTQLVTGFDFRLRRNLPMNFTTGVTLISVAIIALTGFVFYETRSIFSFLILVAMLGVKVFFLVECPKCGHEFTPFYTDDEKTEQAKDIDKV
jgi:hypothetical protein